METVGKTAQLADHLGRALSCQAFIDQGGVLFNPAIVMLVVKSYYSVEIISVSAAVMISILDPEMRLKWRRFARCAFHGIS